VIVHRIAAAAGAVLMGTATLAGSAAGASTSSSASPASFVYRFGAVGSKGKIAATERLTPTPVSGIEGTVVQIATSNSDGYALTSDGTVWAWGAGAFGELGNGSAIRFELRAVRVQFPKGVRITSLANPMPFDGALAIDSTGHAWAWGLNASGDLCASTAVAQRPVRLPLAQVTLATGARDHSLLYAAGRVLACGDGAGGALGTGSTTNVSTPTPVVGLPTTQVVALTSSWEGSGALLRDGTYWNWGYNAAGQLGNGTTTDSAVPVQVRLPDVVRQVFQGGSGPANGQTVAILGNGSVWAWGDNTRGQLGDGTRTSSDVPVPVDVPSGTSFVKVASGGYASYGIDRFGHLWSWGDNSNGQLGRASGPSVETRPVPVGIHAAQVSSTANNVAGFSREGRG